MFEGLQIILESIEGEREGGRKGKRERVEWTDRQTQYKRVSEQESK